MNVQPKARRDVSQAADDLVAGVGVKEHSRGMLVSSFVPVREFNAVCG